MPHAPLPPLPDDVAHVLVAAPPIRSVRHVPCRTLAPPAGPPRDVVVVTYRQPVPDHLARITAAADPPERVAVVHVGPGDHGETHADTPTDLPFELSITSVQAPDSLTELGMTIEGRLRDFADGPGPVSLCFDSLTALVLSTGHEQADRFLGWLRSRVDAVGGIAHYHVDPAAHERPPRELFSGHFDAVVEAGADGIDTGF
jgi:hypothetical protein